MFVSSVSGEFPPPPPKIFGRDELVKEIVSLVDVDDPTPIALIGTGGIGKTSVVLAVLHDDRVKQRFGHHRRFLRCDQFLPSLSNFLRRLSEVIGAGIENPMDLAPLLPFLHRRKMLLVIDNAESLSAGPNTEDILPVVEELSRLRNIYLCITSRTSIVPARCEHIGVPTLSTEAARETFYNIYRRGEQSDTVDVILEQLDFHPLSITLLATAAKYNKWGIDQVEKEWEEQRTRVLRTRYDGSLAATIELSLHSPMFRNLGPHARDLLGVIAFFPRGVDENNLDWLFPTVPDRSNIFDHFCVLSLTHRNEGFVTMLAPLRDHFHPEDPTSASLLCLAKECYFSRLSFSAEARERGDHQTRWIISEDANVESLLDIFTSADANSEAVWNACENFMDHLLWDKPRIPVFVPRIRGLPDDYPSKPNCLSVLSRLHCRIGNYAEHQLFLRHALKLYRERGDDYRVAFALSELSPTSSFLGLHEEGIQQAREAMVIYQRLGNMGGVAACHLWLSSLFRRVDRLDDADECETQAIGLINTAIPTADPTLCAFLHTCLDRIYSNRGETEKAYFHSEAALGKTTARDNRFIAHRGLAADCLARGRLDKAEVHLEHDRSLAVDGTSELGSVMFLQACLLQEQGKFEEARSEALRVLDFVEEFGRGNVGDVEGLLHTIDREEVEYASMGELQAFVAHWTKRRTVSSQSFGCNLPFLDAQIHAALGGDISQDEKIHKAATRLAGLLEKDDGRPGGPNFFQTRKAHEELVALLGHYKDKKTSETIAESLAIPTAMDEPDEMTPLEPLMRQDHA